MTKNQAINLQIAAEIVRGADIRTAYDAVLGQGAFDKLAGEIWEAAQK